MPAFRRIFPNFRIVPESGGRFGFPILRRFRGIDLRVGGAAARRNLAAPRIFS
ncbi:MAG: hypothetical protein ACR2QC_11725 [Gammaproteobacteria bacterium]